MLKIFVQTIKFDKKDHKLSKRGVLDFRYSSNLKTATFILFNSLRLCLQTPAL